MKHVAVKYYGLMILSIGLVLVGFTLALVAITKDQGQTINLTELRTVVLQGAINTESTQHLISEITEKAKLLDSKDRTMYLVLNTSGGNVDEGERLITVIKALKINMKTITAASYSMGFNIAQSLGERLILPGGSVMTHRAYTSVNNLQFPISPSTMMDASEKKILRMYKRVASRIGMNLKEYLNLIRTEYWAYDEDAVDAKMMDRIVSVTCDDSLIRSGRCPLFSF